MLHRMGIVANGLKKKENRIHNTQEVVIFIIIVIVIVIIFIIIIIIIIIFIIDITITLLEKYSDRHQQILIYYNPLLYFYNIIWRIVYRYINHFKKLTFKSRFPGSNGLTQVQSHFK